MAYLGEAKTAEEFAAGHPNHPFVRPGIHFVPKRPSPPKSGDSTTAETPSAPPQDKLSRGP